jgi:UDP-galactopyranose mutase
MTILIVGAGLSGCVIARHYAEWGEKVIIVEKRDHIAGNCYDFRNEAGILVSKYGPHIFHTQSQRVWDYVRRFANWIPYIHRVVGTDGKKTFPVPINLETVNTIYGTCLKTGDEMRNFLADKVIPCDNPANSEELALSRFGPEIYQSVIKEYTMKQWNRDPCDLDAAVVARIPIRYGSADQYFTDKFQAIPENGYTAFVKAILTYPGIEVRLSTEFTRDFEPYARVFYTGPIDAYFKNSGLPPLEYRSLRFETETLPIHQFQAAAQVNYCSLDVPYTRITEYKHFYGMTQSLNKTTIVKEYPADEGEPYYPVVNPKNQALYEQYRFLAEKEEKEKEIFFVGRLANYKYFNMDQAILNALELLDRIG